MKAYTTKHEAKRLVDLGLDPDTCDMFYYEDNVYIMESGKTLSQVNDRLRKLFPDKPDYEPCWSTDGLLQAISVLASGVGVQYMGAKFMWGGISDGYPEKGYHFSPLDAIYSLATTILTHLQGNKSGEENNAE